MAGKIISKSIFILSLLLAFTGCMRKVAGADSALNDEQVKKRHFEKSYHANEANRLVNERKKNEGKRKNYADRKRKLEQKQAESLNGKKDKKSKAIPFTIY